jgi:hypothetical protein
MTFPWPAFLRRALWLRRARRALERGDRESCLELLREPSLALSARAEEMRLVVLEQWCREARRLAAAGKSGDVDGIVARLSVEDPTRASEMRRELGIATNGAVGARIGGILARVRASAGGASSRASSLPAQARSAATIAGMIASDPSGAPAGGDLVRFHIAVDDGGEFYVAGGPSLILGHLRSAEASLPFLADVENRHVRFTSSESFHGGMRWHIERLSARAVQVNGETLGDAPRMLADGDEVVLARNLALRFRQPDDTSGSALLELSQGAECQGVRRVVLLASGAAGRVRIGSKRNRHIPVADLEHEVTLEWSGGELRVSCAGGVRLSSGASGASSLAIPCPPVAASSFVVGARSNARPPFAIHVRPTEPPPSTAGHRS